MSEITCREDWQTRRGSLNHLTFRGRYIPDLTRWLNVLRGEVHNPDLEREFPMTIFPQWEVIAPAIVALAQDYGRDMSPRRVCAELINMKPSAGQNLWLRELVHQMWLTRDQVHSRIARVKAQVNAANDLYKQIRDRQLKGDSSGKLPDELRLFEEFRDACRTVTQGVAEFPSEVRLT
jgi:hypothetical protein